MLYSGTGGEKPGDIGYELRFTQNTAIRVEVV